MSNRKPITIVGGGLAGLGLGLLLRQSGVPVRIFEAGSYPRHRVCGEFISGRGLDLLKRTGLEADALASGGTYARSVTLHWPGRAPVAHRLAEAALSISRYSLDAFLADRFQAAGGELREGCRWEQEDAEPGVVRASGRKAQAVENGWRWFGLKVHARNMALEADLEMHARSDGYVGLSRLPGGVTNVCGLFRRSSKVPMSRGGDWRQTLRGPIGTRLHELMTGAQLQEDTFRSVAGLALAPRSASPHGPLLIGDALTMIPPLTGNGMSMAFEAALHAVRPVAAYSRGDCSWNEAVGAAALACNEAFAQRLCWAKWLQRMLLSRAVPGFVSGAMLGSARLWQLMVRNTR